MARSRFLSMRRDPVEGAGSGRLVCSVRLQPLPRSRTRSRHELCFCSKYIANTVCGRSLRGMRNASGWGCTHEVSHSARVGIWRLIVWSLLGFSAGRHRRVPSGRTHRALLQNDRLQGGDEVNPTERKERRGFASMSPERQREIASKGGRAAHAKGTAHEWTPEEARSAGRKGGQVSRGGRGRLPSEPVGLELPPSPE